MKNALELLKELCQYEFCERNAEKAASLLSEKVCVLGTSDARVIQSRNQAKVYLAKEIAQMEGGCRAEFYDETLAMTGADSSTVCAKVRLENDGLPVSLRISASAGLEDGESRIMSMHLSVADTARYSDESYPVAVKQRTLHAIRDELLVNLLDGGILSGYKAPGLPYYYINDRMLSVLGYGSEEEFEAAVGGLVANCIHPDDRAAVGAEVNLQLAQKGEYSVEFRMRRQDGSHIWVHDVGRLAKAEDDRDIIVSLCYDITDAHHRSQLVDELLSSMNGGIATFRIENGAFYPEFVSTGVAKLLGMTVEEYKASYQLNLRSSIYEADVAMLRATVEAALRQGSSTSLTYRSPHKNGEFVWINGVFSGHGLTKDGKPLVQAIFTPASQQFSSQVNILDSTSTGIYIIDRDTYELYYTNKAGFDTLGVEPCGYMGRTCYDVMRRKSAPCQSCVLHSAAETRQTLEVYTPENGRTHMVHAEKTDWNGKAAIIEYLTDITDLKLADEQLRRSNEMIEAASAYAGMWVWVYDMEKRRARCYRKLREDFGLPEYIEDYPKSGLVFDSFSDEYADAYRAAIERIRHGSESEELEYRGYYGGGEHWLRVRINRLPEADGSHRYAICTALPIDAEKRLESRIELERQKPFSNREALLGYVVSNLSKGSVVSHRRIPRNSPTAIDGSSIAQSVENSLPFYVGESDRAVFLEAHDVDALLDYYERGGTSKTFELRRRLADGSIHWVRNTMDVLRDPVSGDVMMYEYCHDIDNEKKDHLAIDSLVDDEIEYIIMVTARSGKCHLVRSKVLPMEAQMWEGQPFPTALLSLIQEFVHPGDRDKCLEYTNLARVLDVLDREKELSVTYRHLGDDGKVAYKKMRAFYLDDTHADFVMARRDVTDILEADMKQRQLLQETADAANAANRAKSEFMSNMSHDMRTPLNGILGMTYLMQEQQDIAQIKEEAVQLRESGEYLLRLINDVLDVGRIESGNLSLEPRVCDEEQLFTSIIGMVTPLIEEKHIDFHFEKRDITWQYMLLDEQRVKQIFINLLSNAIKFTPPGGRIDFIMQLVSRTDGMVRDKFIVRDNGIGISRDFLPHIFETFRQENRGSVGANNGTGLGLPIVKRLVELMGGSITVESEENRGTEVTVYINFPLAQAPLAPPPGAPCAEPERRLSGLRVLLCEDQPLNAKITRRLLASRNCDVTWAENGKLGLEAFSRSPEGYYGAILMDIRMPVMDGMSAARAIRALPRKDAGRVPIIALSANAYDGDVRSSKASGMNAHLAKPFKPDALFEILAAQTALAEEDSSDG